MASHPPANTPTTRTAVRKPSAVTVAAPASLVPPVKITRGGIPQYSPPHHVPSGCSGASSAPSLNSRRVSLPASKSTRQPLARRFFPLPHYLILRMHTSAAFSFSRCPALCRLRKCGTFYAHSAPLTCIWDMCWLDSTRLQIIIDDHEVMRLRGSAFQLGNITCAAIADPRSAPFPSATAEEKKHFPENMGGKTGANNIAACHPSTHPKISSMMLSKHQGKLLCNMRQNWRKIFFDQHHMVLPYHV
ncbi:hypothetical protein BASA83_008718 [Batrachochytrium salamandrivorans]|nr:hypothetical protein BASA83_008718 [Batrachochytrium salamandrivorans]